MTNLDKTWKGLLVSAAEDAAALGVLADGTVERDDGVSAEYFDWPTVEDGVPGEAPGDIEKDICDSCVWDRVGGYPLLGPG